MSIVEVCEHAGFCFGVERAVNLVEKLLTEGSAPQEASEAGGFENKRDALGGPLYTYGPIIHNETVVEDFESRGVRILNNPEELKQAVPGTLVIRSHGVSRAEEELMRSLGAVTAYNLDGGGSSAMVFNGRVINKPTSYGKTVSERRVSDIVYIG